MTNDAAEKPFTIAVLCGGPSLERGISLNSARSVCDHLESERVRLVPVFFDQQVRPFPISRGQLYSNTPSDFDFKLEGGTPPLSEAGLRELLRSADIVFPVIHGRFGEDGQLQSFLEECGCPYVGPPSWACRAGFDKHTARRTLSEAGFFTLPAFLVESTGAGDLQSLEAFFNRHRLDRAIVKPAQGGSSIGVHSVGSASEAIEKAQLLLGHGLDSRVLVEPFCRGAEFTVLVLQNPDNQPVALVPIEIEMDYSDRAIFDYRRKYLATRQVAYHTPPRFESKVIREIQRMAEEIFSLFRFKDFVRLDGWVLEDGQILFSDINPVSGMEQNSFLFIQAAEMGLSHRDVMAYLLRCSAARQGLALPPTRRADGPDQREPVQVLFGGDTAERHVSIMSGTNVWLKLSRSRRYAPSPFLLDLRGRVWGLPYPLCLYHTVEEITQLCETAAQRESRMETLREEVTERLQLLPGEASVDRFLPEKLSMDAFVARSTCVFIALHGGIGENGTLQQRLSDAGVAFTGSDSQASRLCIDKFATGQALRDLDSEGIYSSAKRVAELQTLLGLDRAALQAFWDAALEELGAGSLVVKPSDDGCSAGVARLADADDLARYLSFLRRGSDRIPARSLSRQPNIIELPPASPAHLLFEGFTETAPIEIQRQRIRIQLDRCPWIEVTVGVLGTRGAMRALTPSITVAESTILSLEEKFQGGTGVNVTPPPAEYVPEKALEAARQRIEKVAARLGLSGFGRIDAFLNVSNGEIIVIEANTIPGLTPSTVIYHQALAEDPPMDPRTFLEEILLHRIPGRPPAEIPDQETPPRPGPP